MSDYVTLPHGVAGRNHRSLGNRRHVFMSGIGALACALILVMAILLLQPPATVRAESQLPICLEDVDIFPSVEPTLTVISRAMTNQIAIPLAGREASFTSLYPASERIASTANVCLAGTVHGQNITGHVGSGANQTVWGGVLRITVDGAPYYGFCTDLHNPISTGQCFNALIGISLPQVACSMYYYPAESPLTYVAPATNVNQEGAARQAAVWYFSDNFVTTSPSAVANRAQNIIDDINNRYANGTCPEVGIPSVTIDPPAAVNALESDGADGYLESPHPFTVTVRMGGQVEAGQPVTVTTSQGTMDGGGTTAIGVTNANGQAFFTVRSNVVGVAEITATAMISHLINLRFDTAPGAQKLLVNWNEPFQATGFATKEWITDSINIQKFHDLNMNGVHDVNEPLIDWTVRWRELPDGAWQESRLGADGNLTIPVDPSAEYEVCEVIPSGSAWVATTPNQCYSGLASGAAVKFGNTNLRALVVYKFHDLNGNGIWDAGEPPLPHWGFTIYEYSQGVWKQRGSGATAADGSKGFTGLEVAPHQVVESLQTGWYSSTAATQYFTFTTQNITGTLTFGNLKPASLIVNKSWNDGGQVGAVEPISICLERTGGALPARVITPRANGVAMVSTTPHWRFCASGLATPITVTNLWPGNWSLEESDTPDWFVNGESTVTLTSQLTKTVNLVNERPSLNLAAEGAIDQPYTWEINKSAAPPELQLVAPGTGVFTYTVTVERIAGALENPRIAGDVSVTNTTSNAVNARLLRVQVDGVDADSWECQVAAALATGATRTCAFTDSTISVPPNTHAVEAVVEFEEGGTQLLMTSTASIDFSQIAPSPVGDSVTVTDTQQTGSWSVDSTQNITYTTVGDCTDIEYDESGAGSKVITNTAAIVETEQDSTTTVTVRCTLTQTLNGYKSVDWSGEPPDSSVRFTICAQGPSFPAGTEPGACQQVSAAGGAFTWGEVLPGEYTITETPPSGWWVAVPPSHVEVRPGQDAQAFVRNVYAPPTPTPTVTPTPTASPTPSPTPTSTLTPQPTNTPTATPTRTATPTAIAPAVQGSIVARKLVDWGVQAADLGQRFTLCLTGNGFTAETPGACQELSFLGGEVAWMGLAPGVYYVSEVGLDANVWQVVGSGAQVIVVGNDEVQVAITNRNTVPTNDPTVEEPLPWYIRLPMILLGGK